MILENAWHLGSVTAREGRNARLRGFDCRPVYGSCEAAVCLPARPSEDGAVCPAPGAGGLELLTCRDGRVFE